MGPFMPFLPQHLLQAQGGVMPVLNPQLAQIAPQKLTVGGKPIPKPGGGTDWMGLLGALQNIQGPPQQPTSFAPSAGLFSNPVQLAPYQGVQLPGLGGLFG